MKKLLFSFMMIVLLSIPNCVLAASSLTIECDENNIAGQTLTCVLDATIEESEINKIEGDINFSDAAVTFELANGITGNINNNKLIIISSSNISSTALGKLNIKYPIETSGMKNITISNIRFYNNETFINTINNISDSVQIKSNERTLKSLSIEECGGCKLNPGFQTNLTVYNLTTTSNNIRISAIANGNATVSGTGLKNLTKQQETFEIIVTSEAGNTKKYKINVKKEEHLSSDNSLQSLTIDSGTLKPEFSSDITSYTATVEKEEVTIDAVATNSKAKISGIGKKTLEYGRNDFNIVVTAEDGTAKNYLVVINRTDTRNSNAYLKELTINGQKIGFEKDIVEYTYTVNSNINKLDIVALSELETSTVTITGNDNLQIGENEVIITVKAEDESAKEYKIIVTKEEIKEGTLLQSLTIEGYNINFNKSTFEYNITIKHGSKLNIITIPANENYKVEILGNENLKNGSIIKIIVSNENNGESNIYKIKVNVSNNSDIPVNNVESDDINYIPYIMMGVLIILVILNIVEIIKKCRKK